MHNNLTGSRTELVLDDMARTEAATSSDTATALYLLGSARFFMQQHQLLPEEVPTHQNPTKGPIMMTAKQSTENARRAVDISTRDYRATAVLAPGLFGPHKLPRVEKILIDGREMPIPTLATNPALAQTLALLAIEYSQQVDTGRPGDMPGLFLRKINDAPDRGLWAHTTLQPGPVALGTIYVGVYYDGSDNATEPAWGLRIEQTKPGPGQRSTLITACRKQDLPLEMFNLTSNLCREIRSRREAAESRRRDLEEMAQRQQLTLF